MFIDEKGKLFGKINVIDFCIAIFIVLALVVSVFKFVLSPADANDDKANFVVEYTLKIAGIRDYTVNQFEKGENVYDVNGETIGKIKDVKVDPAEGMVLKKDGTYNETTWPDRYDVVLTLETKATTNKKGFIVVGEGRQLLSNEELEITNRKYKTTATIMTVNVLEKSKEAKSSK